MPSSILERHEARVKFVLGLLEKNLLRRKDIKTKWLIEGFPESMFNASFALLRNRGYVTKKFPDEYLSPYTITETGKRYLNGIRA